MPRESVGHTFLVAAVLCIVCSLLVSAAAVGLRPQQEANAEREKNKNILRVAGLWDDEIAAQGGDVDKIFEEQVEARIVDLETGDYVSKEVVDPKTYNQNEAASNPAMSVAIDDQADIAGIGRREKYSFVYLVQKDGKLDQVVLPVNGKGLWSTLYGFISLDSDINTIRGLTFYKHGETPGLGGEVDNPAWKALWEGKKAFNSAGEVEIEVIKGTVNPASPDADHEVDGLSGATITSRGVTNLLRYWLGTDGFGPYLDKLRAER